MPPGPDNPWLNAFRAKSTRLDDRSSRRSARSIPRVSRTWRIANPNARNGLGQPTAYKLDSDDDDADAAGAPRFAGRQAGHVRAAQPVGHAVRARRAARRGRVPEPASPAATACPRWTAADRSIVEHRPRRLVQLRRHALRAARGLAGDAGRVLRVLALAVRLLRPQPRARRPAERMRSTASRDTRPRHERRRDRLGPASTCSPPRCDEAGLRGARRRAEPRPQRNRRRDRAAPRRPAPRRQEGRDARAAKESPRTRSTVRPGMCVCAAPPRRVRRSAQHRRVGHQLRAATPGGRSCTRERSAPRSPRRASAARRSR